VWSATLVSVTSATVPTVQPPQPLPIQHRDGSYYPAAAAWAVDLLPRRVREGEERERTVGQGSLPRQAIGCHQVLERYLPSGYILTVHGTTQQGRPFSWTYRGQA
jgi:hypothetical protein